MLEWLTRKWFLFLWRFFNAIWRIAQHPMSHAVKLVDAAPISDFTRSVKRNSGMRCAGNGRNLQHLPSKPCSPVLFGFRLATKVSAVSPLCGGDHISLVYHRVCGSETLSIFHFSRVRQMLKDIFGQQAELASFVPAGNKQLSAEIAFSILQCSPERLARVETRQLHQVLT